MLKTPFLHSTVWLKGENECKQSKPVCLHLLGQCKQTQKSDTINLTVE